jgi:hypothetical protein
MREYINEDNRPEEACDTKKSIHSHLTETFVANEIIAG